MAYIEFDNIGKQYKMGEVIIDALKNTSFTIEKGELVVIVGPSGAGKTTTLNILGGMDTATSGKLIVDNKEITKLKNKELTKYRREDVGFVFQFYNLVQNLTALENVELAVQICKNPCMVDDMYMSLQEVSKLTSWLNRKDFHKLKFFTDEYYDLYFEASFNVSRIELNNVPVGLELTMETKSPYALHDPEIINIESDTTDWEKTIVSKSNNDGYIYPHMSIEVKSNGDLTIYNDLDDKTMQIKNCTSGEIITIDYPIITSSISEHKIQNDFNWKYFRIVNTFKTGRNNLSISIPCKIEMTYSPIVKLGV